MCTAWLFCACSQPRRATGPVNDSGPEERDAASGEEPPPEAGGLEDADAAQPSEADSSARDADSLPDADSVELEQPWPGEDAVNAVDAVDAFASNLSALSYEPARGAEPAVLWAVQNEPSKLFRLVWNGSLWASATSGGWSGGKDLHFPSGSGAPDAEGVTLPLHDGGVRFLYVVSERNNDAPGSRQSVLRFDTTAAGSTLTATHEWDLTSALPAMTVNTGLEAIAFVSDAELTPDFFDENLGRAYAPATHGDHADGVFFVGAEATGMIYGFALDHEDGSFSHVASIVSGLEGVMALEYDADTAQLWAYCDDNCDNRAALLELERDVASKAYGRFVLKRILKRPKGMPNLNNEGITIAPDSECSSGRKSFFWAADGASGGHAIRRGTIPCGRVL
jgi:hypothetical protein